MSDLYQSAIADAKLLREAAIKSVESVILEKYSADIKHAVDEVLQTSDELYEADDKEEGDEDLFGPNADGTPTKDVPDSDAMSSPVGDFDLDSLDTEEPNSEAEEIDMGDSSEENAEDDSFSGIPDASMNGENVDGAVQTVGQIEIDLDELTAMVDSSEDYGDDVENHESMLSDMPEVENKEEAMEEPLTEAQEDDEDEPEQAKKTDKDGRQLIIDDELLEMLAEEMGRFEKNDAVVDTQTNRRYVVVGYDGEGNLMVNARSGEGGRNKIAPEQQKSLVIDRGVRTVDESVDFDYEPRPTGKMGNASLTFGEREDELSKIAVAKVAYEEKEREKASLMETAMKIVEEKVGKLTERMNVLKQENVKLRNENEKLGGELKKVGSKLLEAITSNTKLHYANRVLRDRSLNEQQRERLIETLRDTKSAEEAKSVYETVKTLLESKGERASNTSSRPVAINEVLEGRSRSLSLVHSGNGRDKEQDSIDSHMREQWSKIAGIKRK